MFPRVLNVSVARRNFLPNFVAKLPYDIASNRRSTSKCVFSIDMYYREKDRS